MEKTYKRVPFDIELAKKIQSGEIEGRIVTANDIAVSIRIENNKVLLEDLWFDCSADGTLNGMIKLFIELQEEAPQTFHTEFPKGHAVLHGNTIICVKEEAPKRSEKKQDDFNWLIGDSYNPYPTWL